ncbi:MAG TPA: alpha/beta hydrolase, partial [Chthoniobacterales bacterium]|nr:alpha/beta hydrolase [Chthoniobacterales bacterium]
TLPVILVRGEKDPLAPQRWIDEAARLARAERVAVIPGWGHAVQFSAPEQTVDAIWPFLRSESSVNAGVTTEN